MLSSNIRRNIFFSLEKLVTASWRLELCLWKLTGCHRLRSVIFAPLLVGVSLNLSDSMWMIDNWQHVEQNWFGAGTSLDADYIIFVA